MKQRVLHVVQRSRDGLRKRPVLAALMVYTVGIATAALMGIFAVWAAPAPCPMAQTSGHEYVMRAAPQIVARMAKWKI